MFNHSSLQLHGFNLCLPVVVSCLCIKYTNTIYVRRGLGTMVYCVWCMCELVCVCDIRCPWAASGTLSRMSRHASKTIMDSSNCRKNMRSDQPGKNSISQYHGSIQPVGRILTNQWAACMVRHLHQCSLQPQDTLPYFNVHGTFS